MYFMFFLVLCLVIFLDKETNSMFLQGGFCRSKFFMFYSSGRRKKYCLDSSHTKHRIGKGQGSGEGWEKMKEGCWKTGGGGGERERERDTVILAKGHVCACAGDLADHGALIACRVSGIKLLSRHVTSRAKVCFCRQVSTRQWANCRWFRSLPCLDRAATVQTYHPTKTLSIFSFLLAVCIVTGHD